MPQVISANRLADGTVVYLGPRGAWVEGLEAATLFGSNAECEAGLEKARAAVADNLVVDPFAVAVVEDVTGRRAASLRDMIRALGPTVDYGTGERR